MTVKKKVLYIEDESFNRLLVVKLLEVAGYETYEAASGVDGLDQAAQIVPDLILLDMNMPGLDGYEVATRIKAIEQLSHIPIVALTGNVQARDREKSLIAGCDGYIPKPIDAQNFAELVALYVGGYEEKVEQAREGELLREYNYKLVCKLERKVRELSVALQTTEEASHIKTAFLNTVTHELRTPLNAIIGFSELIEECEDEQEIRAFVDSIKLSSNSLLTLINRIIKFNLLSSGEIKPNLQPTLILQVIESALTALREDVKERGVRVDMQMSEDLPLVLADPQEMKTVMEELLSNALKYSGGKPVSICGEVRPAASTFSDQHGTELVISVKDQGGGIAPAKQAMLFDLTHRSASQPASGYEGVGVGLPLCKKLIELHQGRIWVESDLGQGSEFFVALPLGRVLTL